MPETANGPGVFTARCWPCRAGRYRCPFCPRWFGKASGDARTASKHLAPFPIPNGRESENGARPHRSPVPFSRCIRVLAPSSQYTASCGWDNHILRRIRLIPTALWHYGHNPTHKPIDQGRRGEMADRFDHAGTATRRGTRDEPNSRLFTLGHGAGQHTDERACRHRCEFGSPHAAFGKSGPLRNAPETIALRPGATTRGENIDRPGRNRAQAGRL